MKYINLVLFFIFFIGCGSGGSGFISLTTLDTIENENVISTDKDNDYIPDNIELFLGMDINNSDEDNDGVIDGLQSDGLHGDEFFDKEWHIVSKGTVVNDSGVATIIGNDLDIKEVYHRYMGYNGGKNIIVQVVDSGVDADHEDLIQNMDMIHSLNDTFVGDPSTITNNVHGTMVAGIIAARAFNGKGVRGIIPFAKIAASNWVDYQDYEGLEKAWYSSSGANDISVTNNSWGSYEGMDTSANTVYEEIMKLGSENLRDSKGRIYVFAVGNERYDDYGEKQADANIDYMMNSRYSIAVAGLRHDNVHASYSNPGANILVSGYSGEFFQISPTIASTTIMGASSNTGNINTKTTWNDDINENYTFAMNATSAAAPMVSASIALVLEACPDLTYRDIRYLIAKNSTRVDIENETWVQNAAGLWHSRDYGFGLINPKGMINACLNGYTNLPSEKIQSVTKFFDTPIPDNKLTMSFSVFLTQPNIKIEWIEVTIDNNSSYASDYIIKLVSPSGTKITLVDENQASSLKADWLNGGFRLSSAAMIDEDSQGEWIVEITDMKNADIGTLKSIKLQIYGY